MQIGVAGAASVVPSARRQASSNMRQCPGALRGCLDILRFMQRSRQNSMLRTPRWIWMLGMALLLLAVAPSWSEARSSVGQALGDPGWRSAFGYVVSPPPATRATIPNYLPRLPPEEAQPHRPVAANTRAPLVHVRTRCFCGHHRPRHGRSCRHCHHGAGSGAAHHCGHAGACGHNGRGRFEQRHQQRQLNSVPEDGKGRNVTDQRRGNRRVGKHRRRHARDASAKDHRFQPVEFRAAARTAIAFEVKILEVKILHPQPAAFASSSFHATG